MSARKNDLAGRLGAIAAHSSERATANTTPTASSSDAPRAKPVRVSVDLSPVQYRWLKGWCHEAAEDNGPGVKGVDVIRVLLDQLRDDPALEARVRAALQQLRK